MQLAAQAAPAICRFWHAAHAALHRGIEVLALIDMTPCISGLVPALPHWRIPCASEM